jgi:hypothetical protein
MQLHEEIKVFNKELKGKAVYIKGHDKYGKMVEGIFLVKDVMHDEIYLVSAEGTYKVLKLSDFKGYGCGRLELTILEIPEKK